MDRATDEDEGRGHITARRVEWAGKEASTSYQICASAPVGARHIRYVPPRSMSWHILPDEDTIECTEEEARSTYYQIRASALNVVRTQHIARQNGRR